MPTRMPIESFFAPVREHAAMLIKAWPGVLALCAITAIVTWAIVAYLDEHELSAARQDRDLAQDQLGAAQRKASAAVPSHVGVAATPVVGHADVNALGDHGVAVGQIGTFNQNNAPPTSMTADQRKAVRVTLSHLLTEGNSLVGKCAKEDQPIPETEADDWAKRTVSFLHSSLDDSYVDRFNNPNGLPLGVTSIQDPKHRDLEGWLKARTFMLDKFISENAG